MGVGSYVDPTLFAIMGALILMFIVLCVVLQLFAKYEIETISTYSKLTKKCCTLWSFFLGLVFRKTEASLTQPILVWWTFPWWKTLSQPLKLEVRNNENLWGIHRWSLLITALHWQILQVGKCQTHHLSEPLIPPFLFHPSTTILLMHALHTIDFMREIRYIKSVLLVHYSTAK